MRTLVADGEGVNAVVGTLLVVAMVVVLVGGVFVFANGFKGAVERDSVMVGLVTEGADQAGDGWTLRFQSMTRTAAPSEFDWVLRTPQNGTLFARPVLPFGDRIDLYWELGPGSGQGVHRDNGSVVQTAGFGGFRLTIQDVDGNGVLGAGDRAEYTFDGDGDQGHTGGRDDVLPWGAYSFDLIHRGSGSLSGSLVRDL